MVATDVSPLRAYHRPKKGGVTVKFILVCLSDFDQLHLDFSEALGTWNAFLFTAAGLNEKFV